MHSATLRILAQLALAFPLFICHPVVIFLAVRTLLSAIDRPQENFALLIAWMLSLMIIAAFILLIAISDVTLRKARIRLLLGPGLLYPIGVAALLWLVSNEPGHTTHVWWYIYAIGGPLIVASWNGWRMWRTIDEPQASAALAL